jgi:hypothetical protein
MSTRKLTQDELVKMRRLLKRVRSSFLVLSEGDSSLLFAYRRKLYKELIYDERGKPAARRKLKVQKFESQKGRCAQCRKKLPTKGAVLDRREAMKGYTASNVRLVCPECNVRIQERRKYRG